MEQERGLNWRQIGHDLGLVFCGAVCAYLLSVLMVRVVGLQLVQAIRTWESATARVVLGVLVVDLGRAPVLLAIAWVLGALVGLRPAVSATTLVLLTYALDLAVVAVLGQLGPLYGSVGVVICRAPAVALLIWLAFLVFRRRQR